MNENSISKFYKYTIIDNGKEDKNLVLMDQRSINLLFSKRDVYLNEFLGIIQDYINMSLSLSVNLTEVINLYKDIFISFISSVFSDNNAKEDFLSVFSKSKEFRLHKWEELGLVLSSRTSMNIAELAQLSWYKYDIIPEDLVYEYNSILIKLLNQGFNISYILESINEFNKEKDEVDLHPKLNINN